MRRVLPSAGIAATLALLLASGAASDVAAPRTANLDADAALEQVVPQEVCEATDGTLNPPRPLCASDQISRRRVQIEDTCDGQARAVVISTLQDFVTKLRVIETDGLTRAPEIFFDARSGATGRAGDARVVRYGNRCGEARTLFRHPTNRTTGRLPRGAQARNSFSVSLAERSKRFRGKELRLTETYVDRDDAFCCPSFRRVTYFRYRRDGDRYVPFQTRARRIKAKGKVGPARGRLNTPKVLQGGDAREALRPPAGVADRLGR